MVFYLCVCLFACLVCPLSDIAVFEKRGTFRTLSQDTNDDMQKRNATMVLHLADESREWECRDLYQ